MFKVGDKVICKDASVYLTLNRIYEITKVSDDYVYVMADDGVERNFFLWRFLKRNTKVLITEVDYLNAFQENFKEQ